MRAQRAARDQRHRDDLLTFSVLGQLELIRPQIQNRLTFAVHDRGIDQHACGGDLRDGWLILTRGRSGRPHENERREKQEGAERRLAS